MKNILWLVCLPVIAQLACGSGPVPSADDDAGLLAEAGAVDHVSADLGPADVERSDSGLDAGGGADLAFPDSFLFDAAAGHDAAAVDAAQGSDAQQPRDAAVESGQPGFAQPALDENAGRGWRWVRQNPPFISGLVVQAGTVQLGFDFSAAPSSLDPSLLRALDSQTAQLVDLPLQSLGGGLWQLNYNLEPGAVLLFKYANAQPFARRDG